MLSWLSENLSTIVIALAVGALLAAVVIKMINDKKKGRSSCGCNCGCCPNSGLCHGSYGNTEK